MIDTTNECDVGMDTTQTNGLWGPTEDFSAFSLESFLDGFDLDPDALNLSFLQATGEHPLQPAPLEALAPSQDVTITRPVEDEYSQTRATETATKVQQNWHTYFVKPKSGLTTPDPRQNQVRMDEEYHRGLAAKLQPRVQEDLLPSTSFLVSTRKSPRDDCQLIITGLVRPGLLCQLSLNLAYSPSFIPTKCSERSTLTLHLFSWKSIHGLCSRCIARHHDV